MDYVEVCEICHFLAVRTHPELARFKTEVWLDMLEDKYYKCLICDNIIGSRNDNYTVDWDTIKQLEQHGLAHIKEHNLTAFI